MSEREREYQMTRSPLIDFTFALPPGLRIILEMWMVVIPSDPCCLRSPNWLAMTQMTENYNTLR